MKNKWFWLGLVIAGMAVIFLVAAILIIAFSMDENNSMAWEEGVGLVEVKGVIIDSQDTIKQLNELRKNDKVRAVVLRIDSPGGVVGPSQEIYAEVKKLGARKKVVVSMGSLAASGGYYIAAPAAVIMANPGTITGSIGVLMKFSNIEGLMGKIGMKAYTLKTGKYKDAGSPLRPMSDRDRAMLQRVIDNAHSQFVKAVAEGRRLPVEEIRKLADGRIFTGEQALALKLIDKIGTLQDAIEEAGKLAGIKGEPQVIRPARKKNRLLDLLVGESASRISELVKQESGFSLNYELDGAMR
ncbi:MAG TPA: signal peptide peptidase SppA [Geobacteraceae bacterium]|nr:signal peptide peptidase SppA [Geobacteraceae bacterium]